MAVFLLSNPAFPESVKCRIDAAKENSGFTRFVGGSVKINLENGNTSFFAPLGAEPEELAVINDKTVSSFKADRTACTFGWEKVVEQDGSLRAMDLHFESCAHHDPAKPGFGGYVRAKVGFDFTDRWGYYAEIFMTPSGPVPTDSLAFAGCSLL